MDCCEGACPDKPGRVVAAVNPSTQYVVAMRDLSKLPPEVTIAHELKADWPVKITKWETRVYKMKYDFKKNTTHFNFIVEHDEEEVDGKTKRLACDIRIKEHPGKKQGKYEVRLVPPSDLPSLLATPTPPTPLSSTPARNSLSYLLRDPQPWPLVARTRTCTRRHHLPLHRQRQSVMLSLHRRACLCCATPDRRVRVPRGRPKRDGWRRRWVRRRFDGLRQHGRRQNESDDVHDV